MAACSKMAGCQEMAGFQVMADIQVMGGRLGTVQETRFKDRHCALCKRRGLMQVLLIKYPFGQPVECRSF